MLFTLPTLKKWTPPPSVGLDQSELLVLKDLASSFMNVDVSQLEALLHARASLPDINADGVKPSILTPLDPSSASKLEAQADSTARPAKTSVPSAFDAGPSATPQRPSKSPTPTRSMGWAGDSSSGINQTNSSRPFISDFQSHTRISSQSFNNARISSSVVTNQSNNGTASIGGGTHYQESSREFEGAIIDGSTITNHSNNNNHWQ